MITHFIDREPRTALISEDLQENIDFNTAAGRQYRVNMVHSFFLAADVSSSWDCDMVMGQRYGHGSADSDHYSSQGQISLAKE